RRAGGPGRGRDLLGGAVLRGGAAAGGTPLRLCRAHGRGDPRGRAPAGRARVRSRALMHTARRALVGLIALVFTLTLPQPPRSEPPPAAAQGDDHPKRSAR